MRPFNRQHRKMWNVGSLAKRNTENSAVRTLPPFVFNQPCRILKNPSLKNLLVSRFIVYGIRWICASCPDNIYCRYGVQTTAAAGLATDTDGPQCYANILCGCRGVCSDWHWSAVPHQSSWLFNQYSARLIFKTWLISVNKTQEQMANIFGLLNSKETYVNYPTFFVNSPENILLPYYSNVTWC